jgi:hypothetical protein
MIHILLYQFKKELNLDSGDTFGNRFEGPGQRDWLKLRFIRQIEIFLAGTRRRSR